MNIFLELWLLNIKEKKYRRLWTKESLLKIVEIIQNGRMNIDMVCSF